MGLTYSFTFSAAASVTAAELERFLKTVEADAKRMGFDPTLVFRATFATPEQREFARRIHVLLPVQDAKLQGVVLLGKDQAVNFDPEAGRCRVLPEEAVLLAVTDERQNETVFGFARYPKSLKDANGRPLLAIPGGERWHFSDFIKSPDPRLRSVVKRFADAGYLEAVTDDFNPAKTLTKEQFDATIAANQEIQKRNPFGSEAHRKAYEAIWIGQEASLDRLLNLGCDHLGEKVWKAPGKAVDHGSVPIVPGARLVSLEGVAPALRASASGRGIGAEVWPI